MHVCVLILDLECGAGTATYITCCAAWETFGDQAGHSAQPLDSERPVSKTRLIRDRAKDYAPEITRVKFHWEIINATENPVDNSSEKCNVRKGTNGVSTNGVTANIIFFETGTFWVLPLSYFYLQKKCRGVPFCPNPSKIITSAAAQLVLTPLVRNQQAATPHSVYLYIRVDYNILYCTILHYDMLS